MSDNKKKTSYSTLTGFHRAVPIILLAVAVFIALCFVTQEIGTLGRAISGLLLGLFSWGAYLIPALIALHALFYPSDVGEKRVISRIIFSSVAVISLSAFAHVIKFWENEGIAFSIGRFYRDGQSAIGGGAVGSTVGYGIIEALGSIGLIILAVTVIAIYISYFFSRGKRGIGRLFYGILKGIVFFCAWVEKGIKKLFSRAKNSKKEKKRREAEEKSLELMDDEFFDVDNGIEHLEISELGISERRDPVSVEEHASLHDKVHHRSEVSPEEAAEMERRARERAAASAAYYEDMTAEEPKDVRVDYGFTEGELREGVDGRAAAKPVIEVKAEPVAEEPRTVSTAPVSDEPSADEIFTAEFDPYELAMSDRLASKPSSRSLLDDKPSVREEVHELTEEEVERAKRNAEFERRKAAVVASRRAEEVPVKTEGEFTGEAKTVEFRMEEPEVVVTEAVEEESVSVVIEKPTEDTPVEPVYTPENPYVHTFGDPDVHFTVDKPEADTAPTEPAAPVYTAPVTPAYTEPVVSEPVAPAYTEPVVSEPAYVAPSAKDESGAKATYRRAAEFASMTIADTEEPAPAPAPVKSEPVRTEPAYTAPVRSEPAYTAPAAPAYSEPARTATPVYTEPVRTEPVKSEPAAPVYTAPVASEPAAPVYTAPVASEPAVHTYTAPVESEPVYDEPEVEVPAEPETPYTPVARPKPIYEDTENLYTPTFDIGEVSTEDGGEDVTDAEPDFRDYVAAEDEGGLVFEFDMGKKDEPKVLVTETTHYGDEDVTEPEDPEEAVTEVDEVVEEEPDGEEIPPEKRNPLVSEMRDMFPALRRDEPAVEAEPEVKEGGEADVPAVTVTEVDTVESDPEVDEGESDEDMPPFDAPTTVAAPAPKAEKAEKPKPKPNYKNYKKPPLELMGLEEVNNSDEISSEIRENTNIIIETLASFNVVASIKGVDRGPRITRYEVVPAKGVKVNQITNLLDNITMNLAAEGIRMEAPIPGKSAIGFEIPNKNPTNVRLRELLECEEFINSKSNTFVCIGKDVAGNPVFGDIGKFPHALVAGATGMGKSVCINSIMISLLYKARPDQVKFIMIDPKKVEFRMYSGIPHLLIPVITDAKQAAGALMWAVDEMERRYDVIEKLNIRNIEAYNERQAIDPSIGEHMPKIVIVIDELNDLMMQVRDPVEDLIMRIAQKARAAGIHLIIGTQRPDVKVITGTIKANINTRISCKVTSVVDSRTILEMAGAEKLLNRGDMLFKPVDKTKPIRVQGAFVSDNEVEAIMDFLKSQSEGAQYDDEIFAEINKAAQKCGNKKSGGGAADDDGDDGDSVGYYNDQKFLDAVELAIRSGKISTSLLQRKMSIGYGKAAKYIDAMEEIGVVSEANGQKPRDVLISMDQWYDKLSRVDLG